MAVPPQFKKSTLKRRLEKNGNTSPQFEKKSGKGKGKPPPAALQRRLASKQKPPAGKGNPFAAMMAAQGKK